MSGRYCSFHKGQKRGSVKKNLMLELLNYFAQRHYAVKKKEYQVSYGKDMGLIQNICERYIKEQVDIFFNALPNSWYKDKDITMEMFYAETMKERKSNDLGKLISESLQGKGVRKDPMFYKFDIKELPRE